MGEVDEISFPKLKLPFVEISSADSDPPFQASASVPFKWEEQPGKPRATCSDTRPEPEPAIKSLELPPCMNHQQFTKTPSPTTVLDGPYSSVARPKFSSFRFFTDPHDASFGSPEGTAFEALLGAKKKKERGFFGKFKEVDGGGSCRFSPSTSVSSCESEETFAGVKTNCGLKMRRNGSFSTNISHAKSSQLWTKIYQGIKQAMHWKSSKKSNKQGRD